jgi:hypothetical protein
LPEFTPEFRLLLASALYPLQEPEIGRLQACCSPSIDWQAFGALVARHRLIPTVYRNLSSHVAASVPEPVLANFKEQAKLNRERILQLLAELNRISQWFALEEIKICALKGPMLAQRLYGDAGLRTSRDLDLLVQPDALERADAVLRAHGYQCIFPPASLTPRQWQVYLREWRHINYYLPERQIYIELHWTIASSNLVAPEIVRQMLSHACPVAQLSSNIYMLADEDLLPYLLIHGSVHRWVRLKWLVDFAVGLRQIAQPDWETIKMKMEATGMQRALAQGTILAEWLFSIPIPGPVQALITHDPITQKLAEHSIKKILDMDYPIETGRFSRLKQTFYFIKLKKGTQYKVTAFTKYFLVPEDWQELPLPDAFFPLYLLLMPYKSLKRHYQLWRKNRQVTPPL